MIRKNTWKPKPLSFGSNTPSKPQGVRSAGFLQVKPLGRKRQASRGVSSSSSNGRSIYQKIKDTKEKMYIRKVERLNREMKERDRNRAIDEKRQVVAQYKNEDLEE